MSRTFCLTLAVPSDFPPDEPSGMQRLRKLLKALLRSYGLRCIDIKEQHAEPETSRELKPSFVPSTLPNASNAIPGAFPVNQAMNRGAQCDL